MFKNTNLYSILFLTLLLILDLTAFFLPVAVLPKLGITVGHLFMNAKTGDIKASLYAYFATYILHIMLALVTFTIKAYHLYYRQNIVIVYLFVAVCLSLIGPVMALTFLIKSIYFISDYKFMKVSAPLYMLFVSLFLGFVGSYCENFYSTTDEKTEKEVQL
jgi:hypothetical protein